VKLTFLYAPTTELAAGVAFYRDELGWDEAWRGGADTVAFHVPDSEVQVMVTTDSPHEPPGPMYLVEDVTAFLAGKPSLKVTIPARPIPDGVVAGVQDPTGNTFYIFDQARG